MIRKGTVVSVEENIAKVLFQDLGIMPEGILISKHLEDMIKINDTVLVALIDKFNNGVVIGVI